MPTLFRVLMTIAVLAGIVYAAMFALVVYVKPRQTEMSYRIPADVVNQKPATEPSRGQDTTSQIPPSR